MFRGALRRKRGIFKMSEAFVVETGKRHEGIDFKPYLLRALVAILSIFLCAELIFYLIIVPATSRVNLTVSGSATVGVDEIAALAGLTGKERWLAFDTASVASRLAANPLFESVLVEKKFPDRVIVSVVPRVPVAVSLGLVNGRTVPVEIDQNGVAFRIGAIPAGVSVPLITGLTFEKPVAGMRLNERLKPLLADLKDLESKNPVLLSSVSEIRIDPKTYGGYDLVVYPVNSRVRVRTDKALNEDALQYMMLVLDVVKGLAIDVDEIDIRAGTVSYRVKGGQL